MKMRKKIKNLMFILLLSLCLEGMSLSVFAVTEYVDVYLRYTVENYSVTITGYNGRASEVVIPAKIAGNPVNRIASGAFANATMVTKICLPETIMVIEEGAFAVGQEVNANLSNDSDYIVDVGEEKLTKESDVEVETKSTENEDNRGMFVATALVTVLVLGAVVTAGVVFVRRKK